MAIPNKTKSSTYRAFRFKNDFLDRIYNYLKDYPSSLASFIRNAIEEFLASRGY